MTYDASSRKDVRRAEKYAKLADTQRGEIVKGLMSLPAGRAYVYDKLATVHVFHTSFNLNPLQMAFNEGERNTGLQLLTDLMTYCPRDYVLMLEEANARSIARSGPDRNLSNGNGGDQGPDVGSEGGSHTEGGDYDLYAGEVGDEDRAGG